VKKIASLASGVPVSDFSGGEGHANKLLEAVGFKVVPLRGANPDWVRDELILALDLYLRHRPNPPGKDSNEIRNLSDLLNRLGQRLFPPSLRSATFRNPNGVYMKLMNFRRLDPQYTAGGKKGLTAGAKAEEEVWEEFAGDPHRCALVAKAITASLDEPEDYAPSASEDIHGGFDDAPEGRLLTRKHLARERNRKLVERKKQKVIKETGKLECEVCGFDFAVQYGKRGEGFIECHHTKPLVTLAAEHRTHINDLALVCANCHRMIHRTKPWLGVEELAKILVASVPGHSQ
jgi:5-methylcytosine-specific restriction protein A